MDVDLRDLELLEALGQHATLTEAARHLYVSQPALSQRLIRLEERLGTALFERRGRRLVPNAAGLRLVRAARAGLGEIRAAEHDVRRMARGAAAPVRLASQCATNYRWVTPVVRAFRSVRPGVEVEVLPLADADLVPALLDERLDLAIVTKVGPQFDHVRLQRIFDDELVAVVSARHPWADRAQVTAEDFADVHLLLTEAYDPTRDPAVPLPLPPGARPGRLSTLPVATDMLVEMVGAGEGVTVLPSWTTAPYAEDPDLVVLRVAGPGRHRTWYCATRHGPSPEPLDRFVEVLLDHVPTDRPRGA